MQRTFRLLAFLQCIATLSGCSRHPQLTLVNTASVPATDLVVSGSGFSVKFDRLSPGESKRVSVSLSDESGLQVEFDANGKHYSAKPECYFEDAPNYRVTATIEPGLSVKVDVALKAF